MRDIVTTKIFESTKSLSTEIKRRKQIKHALKLFKNRVSMRYPPNIFLKKIEVNGQDKPEF